MTLPRVNVDVRLKEDDVTHALKRGAKGVVVSVWLSSSGFLCEVEFPNLIKSSPAVRALFHAEQLEVIP
jgi:hypothetical protein